MTPLRLVPCLAFALLATAPGVQPAPAIIPPKNDDELMDAMRRAFREPYANQYERNVLQLLDFLTPKNEERVRQLFGEFNEDGIRRDYAWNAYWRRRGEIDGEATLEALNAGDPTPGYWHHEDVMEGWASVDPAAAERWMRAHTETQYFWVYYQRVIAAWVRTDADRATQILFDLGKDDKYISDALAVLCDTLRLTGTTARIATWFETLNDSAKQTAMNHAAWRIKDGDLQAAAKWFAAQAGKPWRDDKHFDDFLNRYVNADPKAALEWAAALPPLAGSADPAGLQNGLKRWTQKDADAAALWLDGHQDRKWWPRAASGYVLALREKKSPLAEAFLDHLSTEKREAVERKLSR